MTVKRVSPEEALDFLQNEGRVHLDVRARPEFEQGHPQGVAWGPKELPTSRQAEPGQPGDTRQGNPT